MDLDESKVSKKKDNTPGKSTLLLIATGFIIFILILAIIVVIMFKNKRTQVTSYTNPFAPQAQQKTSQNPFAVPTTAYQNPFITKSQQSVNKPYQNPFSGGQK